MLEFLLFLANLLVVALIFMDVVAISYIVYHHFKE